MSFQNIINYAETISVSCRKKVSQTVARDGTVRTTSLGGQVWQFEIQLPNGISWQTMRPIIQGIEALDRTTVGLIQFNKSGQEWLAGYQGNISNLSGVTVNFNPTNGANILTIVSGATVGTGQFRFRAGDLIQLGNGGVYTVVGDVTNSTNSFAVNRPIRDAAGNHTLKIGSNCVFNVICTQLPQWTIFQRNQVSWNGPFVLVESI